MNAHEYIRKKRQNSWVRDYKALQQDDISDENREKKSTTSFLLSIVMFSHSGFGEMLVKRCSASQLVMGQWHKSCFLQREPWAVARWVAQQ